jgi:hypothetical protein
LRAPATRKTYPGFGGMGTTSSNLDFLKQASSTLFNLRVDAATGCVSVPRSALAAHQAELLVVATDGINTVYRRFALSAGAASSDAAAFAATAQAKKSNGVPPLAMHCAYRDTRLAASFAASKHFNERYMRSTLQPGETLRVDDIQSAEVVTYETFDQVFTLFDSMASAQSSKLRAQLLEFSFLVDWPQLEHKVKLQFYNRYASHELHFFLHRKDRSFFDAVVAPFLRNKLQKHFIDTLLLGGAEATRLAVEYSVERLHLLRGFERVLVAEQLSGAKRVAFCRAITEQCNAYKYSQEEIMAQFKAAASARSTADKQSRVRRSPNAPRSSGAQGAAQRGAYGSLRGYGGGGRTGTGGARALTKEYAERGYFFGTPAFTGILHKLCGDYAAHLSAQASEKKSKALFVSTNLTDVLASNSFTDLIYALSVLDVPFAQPKHTVSNPSSGAYTFTCAAAAPVIVFHREMRENADAKQMLSVITKYFDPANPSEYVDGATADKYVNPAQFLQNRTYGCRIVVTNLRSQTMLTNLLEQVPQGAVPVSSYFGGKAFYARTLPTTVQGYGTAVMEYGFYFPALGGPYTHYPVQVSKKAKVIGFGAVHPGGLHVVTLDKVTADKQSWAWTANEAPPATVLAFLRTGNLKRRDINLNDLAWRMQDKAFFAEASAVLLARFEFNTTLLGYAFKHGDLPAMRAVLQLRLRSNASVSGQYFRSALYSHDVFEGDEHNGTYQHLEYHPLINSRAHRLRATQKAQRRNAKASATSHTEIQNLNLRAQYRRFLEYVCWRTTGLDDFPKPLLLSATYYLLLQDRLKEARAMFARIEKPTKKSMWAAVDQGRTLRTHRDQNDDTVLQYDYMRCYFDFFTAGGPVEAKKIAQQYATSYPFAKKRRLFQEVLDQIREMDPDADADAPAAATTRDRDLMNRVAVEPSVSFKLEAGKINVSYRNCDALTINFYPVDLEILFSEQKFITTNSLRSLLNIEPALSMKLAGAMQLPCNKHQHGSVAVPLPAQYATANMFVEVIGPASAKPAPQPSFAHTLSTQVIQAYGQVRVTQAGTTIPVRGAYVKVFCRHTDGREEFYKDGFTDRRGLFDYASLCSAKMTTVSRFSLLIMATERGASIVEASPPPQGD